MKQLTLIGLSILILCLGVGTHSGTQAQTIITATPPALPATIVPGSTTGSMDAATCKQLYNVAQSNLSTHCLTFDQDQICLGNLGLTAQFVDPTTAAGPPLTQVGALVKVNAVSSLTTSAVDPTQNAWGVAVIKAQTATSANLAANQHVILIVYGDTTLKNMVGTNVPVIPATSVPPPTPEPKCNGKVALQTRVRAAPNTTAQVYALLNNNDPVSVTDRSPDGQWVYGTGQGKTGWMFASNLDLSCSMTDLPTYDPTKPRPGREIRVLQMPVLQSFTLVSSTAAATCSNLPPSGLFIETPDGNKVEMHVNGADVVIGSRVLMTAVPNNILTITVITGAVSVSFGGATTNIPPGNFATVPLGGPDGLQATGAPSPAQAIPNLQNFAQAPLPAVCGLASAVGLSSPCALVIPNTAPTATVGSPVNPGQPAS